MCYHYSCLPFASEAHSCACVEEVAQYRQVLTAQQAAHPELFPMAMTQGDTFHRAYALRKLGVVVRRVKVNLVGATVKDETQMPADLIADEKITWVQGPEVSVPTTVGGGCFLSVSVVTQEAQAALQAGYGVFAQEAQAVFPDSAPQSVCTDGWAAPQAAWRALVPTIILVLCYLHACLKIAARCTGTLRQQVLTRAWDAYHAPTKAAFAQRVRRLGEWGQAHLTGAVGAAVAKLWQRRQQFTPAYDCPTAARNQQCRRPLAEPSGSATLQRRLRPQ